MKLNERTPSVSFANSDPALVEKLRSSYQHQLDAFISHLNKDAQKYVGQTVPFGGTEATITKIEVYLTYKGEVDIEMKGKLADDE